MQTNKVNIICVDSTIEGKLECTNYTRFEGKLRGEIVGKTGSVLVIGENAMVEGTINGHTVVIDGYLRGEIRAKHKITISGSGRVIGNLFAPNIEIQFGSLFDGKCHMESELPVQKTAPPAQIHP